MRPIDADELHMYYEKRMDFERHRNHAYLKGVRDCIKDLESKPTIEPERKKGKWIENKAHTIVRCSHCDASNLWKSPYCPYCGAEMEGKEDG